MPAHLSPSETTFNFFVSHPLPYAALEEATFCCAIFYIFIFYVLHPLPYAAFEEATSCCAIFGKLFTF